MALLGSSQNHSVAADDMGAGHGLVEAHKTLQNSSL
jgi:hypothetical protein